MSADRYPMANMGQMQIGSVVSARAIQIMSKIKLSDEFSERDNWWTNVREEISKSTQALGCSHVLGYRERVTIHGDIILLSAFGTAVRFKPRKRLINSSQSVDLKSTGM